MMSPMKKILVIVAIGLLLNNSAFAKILNVTNEIRLKVPNNFTFAKLNQNYFEEMDDWDKYFGSSSEIYYLGTKESVKFSIEILDNPDEILEPIMDKMEKKNFQSEKSMTKFLGKEIIKLAKKRKYESVVFIIKGGISITELISENNEFKDFMNEINSMSSHELEKEVKKGKKDFIKDFNDSLGEFQKFYKFNNIIFSKDINDNPYMKLNYKGSIPPLSTIGQWFLFIHNDMPYFMGVDCMGCSKLKDLSLNTMIEPMLISNKK